jgi:ArsR family transcriptional regulator
MEEFYTLHANVCKTFGHPVRLRIIELLRDKEISATELLESLNISKPNLSQHMSMLVKEGIVVSRKEGVHIFYQISDKRIIQAFELMKEVLINRMKKDTTILKTLI